MSDVLLICPKTNRPFHHKYIPLSPPLGLGYIARSLHINGISFRLIDMYCINATLNDIRNLIIEENPRMLGFLTYSEAVNAMYTICDIAKEINKKILTVAGGPHATFKTKDILQNNENLDIAIAHEGEEIIIELWEELNKTNQDFSHIKGIAYKNDDQVIQNPLRKPIYDLDKYGYLDRKWYPHIEKYLEPSTIISSRGCPGNCIFCGGANISGGIYRKRSVDSVLEEVEYLKRMFPNDVTIFWDDAFGFDSRRLTSMCNAFVNVQPFQWSCGMRVDRVSQEILTLMHTSGCVKINFGVESGSQQILDDDKKGVSLDQIRKAVKWSENAHIYNSCSIIIGYPNDTEETVGETLAFAEELLNNGATSCTFNAMVPFPGTYVYERRDQLNINFLTDKWEDFNFLNPVFETKGLNDNELRKYLIKGLLLWGKYKNNRDKVHERIRKRDAILLGDLIGRNVQT